MTACVGVLINESYAEMKPKYGIPRSTITCHLRKICLPLQCRNMRQLQQRMKTGEVSRSKLIEVLQLSAKNNKVGRPNYLSLDEESLVVVAADIEGAHGLPINTFSISYELQFVLASVKARPTCKKITYSAAAKYCPVVVKQVNVSGEAHDNQRKKSRTRLIKVSSLSHNRAKQSDTRLAWIMFHNLAHMY